jgi:hypothetical protein
MNAKNAAGVPQLTSTKLDGTPYARHADVTEAIACSLALPKGQRVEWSSGLKGPALRARQFLVKSTATADKDVFGKLVWQLHLRIEQVAKRWARGLDRDTTEEVIEGVQKRVMEIALTTPPSRQSDFLEVAFSQAVKRYTLNAVEKRRNAPLPLNPKQHAALEDDGEDAERPTERVEDDSPQVEELVSLLQDQARRGPLLRRAQAAVKDIRHYEAILLHYGFGWPYAPGNPAEPCLQDYFGVSERQIRNWIKDGMAAIRTALEKSHDD